MCKLRLYLSGIFLCKIRSKGSETMFHVERTEYGNKTFRLPIDLIRTLEQVAQRENVSVNQLVIQCCRYALSHLEETPGEKP